MEHVEHQHVREWLARGGAEVVPPFHAAAFAGYLNDLPWLGGSAPDWSRIGVTRLMLDDEHFWEELLVTPLGGFDHAFLMYAPAERGIVGALRDVIADIDLLTWRAPGVTFLCGATREDSQWTIEPPAFAAYEGKDDLVVGD